ncbi:neuromedin-B isoform X1 [Pipistrellus kuhlii]|uniref:Neuromedin B n=1 Tax=Pipistrellus kuhlii TaxID=59472 RepID=A0A7J7S5K8_PIPKU|nr:neuromedin-B isoform X1 [Pipistrellus kuhlii]KAF6283527.1 neuromedin B [Pipistrellus kuhlii]
MALRAGGARWLLGAVLLLALLAASTASLGWDLREPRSRAGRIRVHPRGNLWATGHFMGKKSLEPPGSSLLKTAPHVSLGEQRLQLSHDLLRILLLKKALAMSPRGPAPHTQEAAGANAAEVMALARKTQQRGLDCAHPGTLEVAPSGCKFWAQTAVTPFL